MREKEDQKLNVKVTQEGGREGRKEERKELVSSVVYHFIKM